jgi:hypothetical protein
MTGTFAFAPVVMEKSMAAFYISVSPRKFDQLLSEQRITPHRFDGKKVYKRDDLDALAAELPEWQVAS